ncbi:hypothetical protein BN2475_190162 [Paraburkholderia ribeironis]|uniref:Uncharacterized protein n=1 Tax=Paraburkholderia ribeironis TaxID=1247936 RepID=A0A1N7RW03_9BURK|nr:hypothetical protein BN2475_190162 [Paraburkholderia ribeironis]
MIQQQQQQHVHVHVRVIFTHSVQALRMQASFARRRMTAAAAARKSGRRLPGGFSSGDRTDRRSCARSRRKPC